MSELSSSTFTGQSSSLVVIRNFSFHSTRENCRVNLFNMWVRYGCYLCLQQLDILNLVTWSEKQLHESLSLLSTKISKWLSEDCAFLRGEDKWESSRNRKGLCKGTANEKTKEKMWTNPIGCEARISEKGEEKKMLKNAHWARGEGKRKGWEEKTLKNSHEVRGEDRRKGWGKKV